VEGEEGEEESERESCEGENGRDCLEGELRRHGILGELIFFIAHYLSKPDLNYQISVTFKGCCRRASRDSFIFPCVLSSKPPSNSYFTEILEPSFLAAMSILEIETYMRQDTQW
jgi:hypothetical protein